MTRPYAQRARAEKARETRQRILEAAQGRLPAADELRVEEIARLAGVSVQTLYSHFGSKGGLLLALFDELMREGGLYAGFERVWRSKHGETALRAMLEATLRFWESAWPLVEFGLRVRRVDRELGARINRFDESRLGDLIVICRRLREEARLATGLSVDGAATLAFGLTTPYVYEALVVQNGMPAPAARARVQEAVVATIVRPGSRPVPADRIDWKRPGLGPPPSG